MRELLTKYEEEERKREEEKEETEKRGGFSVILPLLPLAAEQARKATEADE